MLQSDLQHPAPLADAPRLRQGPCPSRRWPWKPSVLGLTVLALLMGLLMPTLLRAEVRQWGDNYLHDGCLRLSLIGYRDLHGEFNNHDWVTLLAENRCSYFISLLEIAVLLVDANGISFGGKVWVMGKGEVFPPGKTFRERFAIPDPDNLIATGWRMKVTGIKRLVRKKRN